MTSKKSPNPARTPSTANNASSKRPQSGNRGTDNRAGSNRGSDNRAGSNRN